MAYLVDTNVLLRWVQPDSPECAVATAAVDALQEAGEDVCMTAQNITEFWAVATRTVEANGLAMPPGEVEAHAAWLESTFLFLPDGASVYPEWRRLVVAYGVTGAQVYDTRLVAVMRAYGVSHLLTFNIEHFRHYSGITVVHPRKIVAPGTPGS